MPKRKLYKNKLVIFFIVSIFSAGILFRNQVFKLYKYATLYLFYKNLTFLEINYDWASIYDLFSKEKMSSISKQKFIYQQNQYEKPVSKQYLVHSYSVINNKGIIDRTLIECYSSDCVGEDRYESRAEKLFIYENGNWRIPLASFFSAYCLKDAPYKIHPEFERALSIISQRYSFNTSDKDYFESFRSIRNCLSVEYSDVDGAEGFFVFDPNLVKQDYLPIFVNNKYKEMDDISIAILLSHELAHVFQFLREASSQDTLSCIEKEVEAFFYQFSLTLRLYKDERQNLATLIDKYYYGVNPNPQIQVTRQLHELSVDASNICGSNSDCWKQTFYENLRTIVRNNPIYQEQCSGK